MSLLLGESGINHLDYAELYSTLPHFRRSSFTKDETMVAANQAHRDIVNKANRY